MWNYPAAMLFWFIAAVLNRWQATSTEQKYLNPPPEYIEYFHFGFRETLADSFWLRWIQDSDFCQTYLKPVRQVPKDQIEYLTEENRRDLTVNPRYKICDNSWSFKMLDATTRLAPKFLMPYVAGASTLAILVEDYEGATVLYERGIKARPDDWQLLYRASYHYQFNLKDKIKAAELLNRAADLGGPNWMKSLAARLLTKAGDLELAIRTLLEYREVVKDQASEDTLSKLDKRIEQIKAQLNATGP